ncbi:SCP2 sterol-binding domain-containing protein [Nocardia jiangxiensis]|uniref:SCP2 sterol-binding domain-containing protein n=1 Tax=Nocardia jiangxiensis TaxID=282685 RepID=UPI0002D95B90|nr:SCP2 sterol-binding domain-containing protein [Nocardia jiangxiensis]
MHAAGEFPQLGEGRASGEGEFLRSAQARWDRPGHRRAVSFLSEQGAAAEQFRAEWALVFVADSLEPDALRNLAVDYEFHIDDSVARMRISDGRAEITTGTSEIPATAVLRSDAATVGAIAGGRHTVTDAVMHGRIRPEGDPEALQTLLTLLNTQVKSLVAQVGGPERSGTA